MHRAAWRADGLLLLAAAIWGVAFVAQRAAMAHLGPLTYTGIRFCLGVLVLLPLLRIRRGLPAQHTPAPALSWLAAGLLLFIGITCQQIGLVYTTAGKAGFITGLYVVLVPLLGLFLRQRPAATTWLGAALAAVGLYFLSVTASLTINPGDALVLTCAFVWAVHVLLLGWLAPRVDALRLALTQFTVAGVAALLIGLVTEHTTLAGLRAALWPILYGGVCSVAIGYTLQIVGQAGAPPAHAAILLSLESVFAALTGRWLLAEVLGPRELLGCALMLAGVVVTQVRRTPRPDAAHSARAGS